MTKTESHRVVVGVDGSRNSVAALHLAAVEALRRHAELDIVHVVPPDAYGTQVADSTLLLQAIVTREFPEGLTVPAKRRVERGDPAPILLSASADAELLVIGARDRTGHPTLFGSRTVWRCLDYGRCPVKVCAS
jgi:nucleotide-binding universal stress UspA family protein